jgi:hypothetical protein
MTKYTKEEKKAYFLKLRELWKANKVIADSDTNAKAKYEAIVKESPNYKISYYSFYFILKDMLAQKLDGNPYVDTKTYKGWKEAGFQVKKGEESKLHGITWVTPQEDDEEDENNFVYPKMYNLFHRSQVESIQ